MFPPKEPVCVQPTPPADCGNLHRPIASRRWGATALTGAEAGGFDAVRTLKGTLDMKPAKAVLAALVLLAPAGPALAADEACPRPSLPFTLSEAVWSRLEGSEAYRATPATPGLDLDFRKVTIMTGKRFRNEQTELHHVELRPVTPCVGLKATRLVISGTSKVTLAPATTMGPSTSAFQSWSVLGGLVELGSTSGGAVASRLEEVVDLSGSLFPPRAGAEVHLAVRYAISGQSVASGMTCRMGEARPATTLDPRLAGRAWPVSCQAPGRPPAEDAWLEDAGVFLSRLQQVVSDGARGFRMVIPVAGLSASNPVPALDGTNTETFTAYDWRRVP